MKKDTIRNVWEDLVAYKPDGYYDDISTSFDNLYGEGDKISDVYRAALELATTPEPLEDAEKELAQKHVACYLPTGFIYTGMVMYGMMAKLKSS